MPSFKSISPKFYLFVAVAMWGIATPVIKATVTNVPPFTFLMLRFWIAAIITIPASIYILKHNRINLDRAKHIFISSILGHVISLSLIFGGLSKTSSLEGSVLTAFSPLLVAILGFIILREILIKRKIEGILIAFIGTIILLGVPLFSSVSYSSSTSSVLGNILFFVGILFDGLYVIYVKKYLSNDKILNPTSLTILSFAIAAIIFTPLGLFEQNQNYRNINYGNIRNCAISDIDSGAYSLEYSCNSTGCFNKKDPTQYDCILRKNMPTYSYHLKTNIGEYLKYPNIIGIIYMAMLSGLIAYIFFQKGLKNLKASESAIFYYLQPLFGVPISIIFLHEELSLIFAIGAITILCGIYIAEFKKN